MAFNMRTKPTIWKKWLLPAALLLSLPTSAAEYQITIKAHHFVPDTLHITAHERHRITILNQDDTPEEFESYSLNREKVVAGNSKIIIFLPPLTPGEHPFFGEFNQESAQGRIIIK
ncbi:MAG: cupredoxin domain-containing protein [Mariprofundales bacterium]